MNTSSSAAAVVMAIVAAAALTSCVNEPTSPTPTPTSTLASPPASASPLPTATEADHLDEGAPPPAAAPDAEVSALALARQVVELYARPTVPQSEWFTDLQPHLSSYAGSLFVNVDPSTIAARDVVGEPVFEQPANAYFARVRVATDAGDFIISLERLHDTEPWLADRIDPAS